MTQPVTLRMSGKLHATLMSHLIPGDGLEAVAVGLCGRRSGESRHCLTLCKLILIPHIDCDRRTDRVTWRTEKIVPLLQEAEDNDLAVVKFHSHPSGYRRFSAVDDKSDTELFSSVSSWIGSDGIHASVIMLPDGEMFGRTVVSDSPGEPIDLISVAGDTIRYWFGQPSDFVPQFADRHAQVLGEETAAVLRHLRCGVVGCSGTGSPTVEQLYRLGFGEVVLVDPETGEVENLNRILNLRSRDVDEKRSKVEVQVRAISEAGLGTTVFPIAQDLCSPDVIRQVAECDVLFGCVDSIYGRHVLNKIASTYCIPFIDIGVRLVADGTGGIEHVTGAVHYLQPDGSSLLSRKVYSLDDLSAEALRATDPVEYSKRRDEGYISGADVARPAVIPVNMVFSGLGVFEFLCRLRPLRDESNQGFASQRISLSHAFSDNNEDGERCPVVTRYQGRGDMSPLLGMPEFSERAIACDE